jgi:AraC-like DNA-binding protein
MIKDLINIDLKDLPIEGLDVHIIKKYIVKTAADESFKVNNFSILLIKSGKFRIRIKEITQHLSAHDFIAIPKNSFCTVLEVQDRLQFYLISFSPEFAFQNCLKKELVEAFYFFIGKSSVKITLEEKDFIVLSLIYKLIYYVNSDAKNNGLERTLQRISFNLFLYELKLIFGKYSSTEKLNFTRKETLAIHFLTLLTIHCKKQHSVKFYAGSLFVTSGHLNKIVKQITGKTVKILIAEAIISEAKNLLDDPQISIASAAEDLEFSTSSSFSNFFKRHTSTSPSEYRSNTIEKSKDR